MAGVDKYGDPLKTHCFCGIHVHSATKIIAYIGLGFQVFGIVAGILALIFLPASTTTNTNGARSFSFDSNGNLVTDSSTSVGYGMPNFVSQLMSVAIAVVIYGCLLYGVKNKRTGYYWPYLIIIVIGLVILGLVVVVNFVGSIFALFGMGFLAQKMSIVWLVLAVIAINAISIAFYALYFYIFFLVVNRSRKLVDAELWGRNTVSPVVSPVAQVPVSGAYQPNTYQNKV